MANVYFSTREYEFNHGAKPRGRGNWAFVETKHAKKANYLDFVFWAGPDLTYGEAKRKAAEHFRAKNPEAAYVDLVVCS